LSNPVFHFLIKIFIPNVFYLKKVNHVDRKDEEQKSWFEQPFLRYLDLIYGRWIKENTCILQRSTSFTIYNINKFTKITSWFATLGWQIMETNEKKL